MCLRRDRKSERKGEKTVWQGDREMREGEIEGEIQGSKSERMRGRKGKREGERERCRQREGKTSSPVRMMSVSAVEPPSLPQCAADSLPQPLSGAERGSARQRKKDRTTERGEQRDEER